MTLNVDTEAKTRVERDEVEARKAGFTPEPPIYAAGTKLVEAGRKNWTRSKTQWENLPTLKTAMDALYERVRAELREDLTFSPKNLEMLTDGALVVPGGPSGQMLLPMEKRGFESLCNHVEPLNLGVRFLANCDPDLRAANVNRYLPRHPGDLKLRTRIPPTNLKISTRSIYGAVSTKYRPFDTDALAHLLSQHPADGGRCEVQYDGYRARIDLLYHSDVKPEEAAAGEFFKAGVRVRSADDGSGAIYVESVLWRNLCLNLIVVNQDRKQVLQRRHVGEGIGEAISLGFVSARERLAFFRATWGQAARENVLQDAGGDALMMFYGLVASGLLPASGGIKHAGEQYLTAWSKEPGENVTAVVNAVSRAAHEGAWSDPWMDESLAEVAGNLLVMKAARLRQAIKSGVEEVKGRPTWMAHLQAQAS